MRITVGVDVAYAGVVVDYGVVIVIICGCDVDVVVDDVGMYDVVVAVVCGGDVVIVDVGVVVCYDGAMVVVVYFVVVVFFFH